MVHNIVNSNSNSKSLVFYWNQEHQFSRGTNFQCFAITGDGSVVVGLIDGKDTFVFKDFYEASEDCLSKKKSFKAFLNSTQ